jgi:hypothetical protein
MKAMTAREHTINSPLFPVIFDKQLLKYFYILYLSCRLFATLESAPAQNRPPCLAGHTFHKAMTLGTLTGFWLVSSLGHVYGSFSITLPRANQPGCSSWGVFNNGYSLILATFPPFSKYFPQLLQGSRKSVYKYSPVLRRLLWFLLAHRMVCGKVVYF